MTPPAILMTAAQMMKMSVWCHCIHSTLTAHTTRRLEACTAWVESAALVQGLTLFSKCLTTCASTTRDLRSGVLLGAMLSSVLAGTVS